MGCSRGALEVRASGQQEELTHVNRLRLFNQRCRHVVAVKSQRPYDVVIESVTKSVGNVVQNIE